MTEVKCPICGDVFHMYPVPDAPPEPWYFVVFHAHEPEATDSGVWTGMVFKHHPRQRYPNGYKELMQRLADNKRRGKVKPPPERGTETCPLHPDGCEGQHDTTHIEHGHPGEIVPIAVPRKEKREASTDA